MSLAIEIQYVLFEYIMNDISYVLYKIAYVQNNCIRRHEIDVSRIKNM